MGGGEGIGVARAFDDEEIEAGRRGSEIGGLMGRIAKEGEEIDFKGVAVLRHAGENRVLLKAPKIRRVIQGRYSGISLIGSGGSMNVQVNNLSWNVVPKDTPGYVPGFEGYPYLEAKVVDASYSVGSTLRFYPSKPEKKR